MGVFFFIYTKFSQFLFCLRVTFTYIQKVYSYAQTLTIISLMECEDSDIQCPCCFETVPKTTTVKCHKCEMESCRACLLDWFKQQQSTTCLACSSMFTQRDVPSLDVTVFKYPFWLPLNKFDGRSYSLHMSCCGNLLD